MNYKKFLILVVIIVFSFTIVSMGCVKEKNKPIALVNSSGLPLMTVYYVDVGQGDAEIIQLPSGKTLLIDAGDTGSDEEIGYYLDKLGVTTIDTVIVSHPHADHIGGMDKILNKYHVLNYMESGYATTASTYEKVIDTVDNKNINYKEVHTGDILTIDPKVQIMVLNPSERANDLNDNSVVVRMIYNETSFLFTGDIDKDQEEEMKGLNHIDILKVAHHGSDSSTFATFILRTSPSVSIISVGKDNSYGHPSIDVIKNLNTISSMVYRTDMDGTIIVKTDGNSYNVETTKLNTWH